MRKNILTAAAATAFAASLALAAPASAAHTYDPATGGFVGKGDVQTAFTWNNAQLQANAANVTFSYQTETNYSAVCEWFTGQNSPKGAKSHDVTHKTSASVVSSIAYESRTRNQITGFILQAAGSPISSGEVPLVGGPCPGNDGHSGTWVSVEPAGSSGGLYVNHAGVSVLLP